MVKFNVKKKVAPKKRKFRVKKKEAPKKELKESSRNPPKKKAVKKVSKATATYRATLDRKTGIKKRQVKPKPAAWSNIGMGHGPYSTNNHPLAVLTEGGYVGRPGNMRYQSAGFKTKLKRRNKKALGIMLPPTK